MENKGKLIVIVCLAQKGVEVVLASWEVGRVSLETPASLRGAVVKQSIFFYSTSRYRTLYSHNSLNLTVVTWSYKEENNKEPPCKYECLARFLSWIVELPQPKGKGTQTLVLGIISLTKLIIVIIEVILAQFGS